MRTKGQTGRKGMARLTEQFYGLNLVKASGKYVNGQAKIME